MNHYPTGVRRRKNGLLQKRFTVNGRRYSVYGRTLRRLRDQEQSKRKALSQAAPPASALTADQYFETWLEGKRLSVKPSTLRVYATYYRPYASPVIGQLPLKDITRRDILAMQAEAARHLRPTTVNILLRIVQTMLNTAVSEGLLPRNPARGVGCMKVTEKAAETYHRALTEGEQATFMTAARDSFYYELLAFQLLTGVRLGEAAALQWTDIDQTVIHIRRTVTRTEEGVPVLGASTKTEAGERDIPINAAIRALLRRQRQKWETLPKLPGCEMLCFLSPRGQLVGHGAVNRAIRTILSRLRAQGTDIPPFTSHALRDTFATRYIEQGGTPQTLKTILGHSSLAMTMDLYSHVLPNTKQAEMDRVNIRV